MWKKIKHEFRRMLPVILYFFVALNIVALCHGLMTKGYKWWLTGFALASVWAILVGKAVVIADATRFITVFENKPAIYSVVWKTSVYVIASILVRYIELAIEFARKYGGLAAGSEHIFQEADWPRFWAIQIWLFVFFLVFAGLTELDRILGPGELRKIFFGK